MKHAEYVLVRYNPDPGRNEFLNVGAIIWDGERCRVGIDSDAVARVVRENPTLDRNSLLYLQKHLESRLNLFEMPDGDGLREWVSREPGFPVAYTEPRFTTLTSSDIDESLQRILRRSVTPRRRSGPSAQTPLQVLESHLQPLLRSQRIVKDHPFLGTKSGVPWSAHFFANHGTNVAMDALQLDIRRGEEIRTRAAAQAYKVEDALGGTIRQYLVYCAFPVSDEADAAGTAAEQILERAGATVFTDADAAARSIYALATR